MSHYMEGQEKKNRKGLRQFWVPTRRAYKKTLEDKRFMGACELAKLSATYRQATKYAKKRGLAFQFRNDVKLENPEELATKS